jgi:adenosylhomocysteine nucleosidase
MRNEARTLCGGPWRKDQAGFSCTKHTPQGSTILYRQAGVGPARAARAARAALADGADLLLSLGVSGGLDPSLAPGNVVAATAVLDASTPEAPLLPVDETCSGTLAGLLVRDGATVCRGLAVALDRPVAGAREKAELLRRTGGMCVDTESAAAAREAREAGVPFVCVRVVSDPSGRSLPAEALAALSGDGRLAPWRLAVSVMRRPRAVLELAGLAREFSAARRSLELAGRALVQMLEERARSRF